MKIHKNTARLLAALLTAAILLTAAAGCSNDTDSFFTPPEFVYVSETVALPGDIGDINTMAFSDGKLFIVASSYESDEEAYYKYSYKSKLFSMNIDGSSVMQLPEYVPPAEITADVSGEMSISSINVDADGNLWVVERWNLVSYNLPDGFDPGMDNPWEYQESLGSGSAIRKLNSAGAELLTVDLSVISQGKEYFYINSFNIDAAGNIYLSTDEWDRGGMAIYVLDSSGNVQFDLLVEQWFERFIRISDGSLAIATDRQDENGNYSRVLLKIDYAGRDFGEAVPLPQIGWNVFPGGGEYDLLISDYTNGLSGFKIGDEEAVKLLDWIDSDIINNGINNIVMLDDGRIICTNNTWDRITYQSGYEVLILTKTPYSELPERTVLTLATFYLSNNRDAVVKFNRTNTKYRIQVIDYSQFSTPDDYMAGLNRLSTEIISGRIPDILDVSNLPYKEYAARGILEDLYPFIASDENIKDGDLIDGALRAAEIDGKLYQIFPSFYVQTLAGHPDVVGNDIGWNVEEFKAVIDANPGADMPLGMWLTKMNFLQAAISFGIDEYIDWGNSKVSFDTPEFIQLLEFANIFPDEIDWDRVQWEDVYVPEDEAIATGRQIMVQMTVSEFYNYMWYKSMFGGELVFKGFPNESRNGNSLTVDGALAMMKDSKNKDGAWEFMSTILDKDWQLGYTWSFPTNKEAFDARIKEAMEREYDFGFGIARPMPARRGGGGAVILDDASSGQTQALKLTQADVDKIMELIDSASGTAGWNVDTTIWEIISESITDYFNGATSAQDAARVIQSRVQILVSERS